MMFYSAVLPCVAALSLPVPCAFEAPWTGSHLSSEMRDAKVRSVTASRCCNSIKAYIQAPFFPFSLIKETRIVAMAGEQSPVPVAGSNVHFSCQKQATKTAEKFLLGSSGTLEQGVEML